MGAGGGCWGVASLCVCVCVCFYEKRVRGLDVLLHLAWQSTGRTGRRTADHQGGHLDGALYILVFL